MNRTELLELITNGENSGIEFKREDIRPEQLAREIVALANFRGGRLLLGVEDDGAISGIQRPRLKEWAMQNSMTVEKMVAGQRSPRNTLVVEVLRDYGYVDARGMGVRTKIIPLLTRQNGVPPEFVATEDYLAVKMYRGPGSDG